MTDIDEEIEAWKSGVFGTRGNDVSRRQMFAMTTEGFEQAIRLMRRPTASQRVREAINVALSNALSDGSIHVSDFDAATEFMDGHP